MARAIDKETMLDLIIKAKRTDPETGSFAEWLAEYLVEHLPTLTQPNEWVAVEERLPEYNPGTGAKSYWVAKKDSAGNWQMKIAQYCDYGYAMTVDAETEITWRDWDFTKIVSVTHWMPLPAPPDKDNNVLAKTPNEPLSVLVNDEPDREYIDYICPRCKNTISQRRRGQRMETVYKCKFHDNCGQRVDWSNPQPYRRPPEGEI